MQSTEVSVASVSEYQGLEITVEMIKKILDWMRDRLYCILHVYERDEGQIDKDAFVGINLVFHSLLKSRRNSHPDNTIVLFPTRQLLSLFLLTDNSGDFEQ